jgi:Flp pilus assembly protein TadG
MSLMTWQIRGAFRKPQGVVLVELAFAFMILLPLLYGLLQFCSVVQEEVLVLRAAREAARAATRINGAGMSVGELMDALEDQGAAAAQAVFSVAGRSSSNYEIGVDGAALAASAGAIAIEISVRPITPPSIGVLRSTAQEARMPAEKSPGSRGAVMLEAVISFAFFLTIAMGVIQIGYYWGVDLYAHDALDEAARRLGLTARQLHSDCRELAGQIVDEEFARVGLVKLGFSISTVQSGQYERTSLTLTAGYNPCGFCRLLKVGDKQASVLVSFEDPQACRTN